VYLLDGTTQEGEIDAEARDRVMGELRGHFRPEFLNRVDEIVMFKPLTMAEIERIVELQIADVQQRLADRRMTLELTKEAEQLIARHGYDPVYGARPLRRYIQREVETRIGRALIAGDIHDGARIVVDAESDELVVRWRNPEEEGAEQEPVGAAA
jgi:ATP-dependent Clp protease ATP-binding subunit ClpB